MKTKDIKKIVREGYGKIAKAESSCCIPRPAESSCCAPAVGDLEGVARSKELGREIGYSDKELESVPDGANLGLGCGNPVALASLKEGEIVLDLGSGAGFDCFLAAGRVGTSGMVIGVDMTPEMVDKARLNAEKGGYKNVEFRLGEIENLPTADGSVDVVISNCVINLVPDKRRVFSETYRVLKPGGRMMISDLVLTKELPAHIRESVEAYVGCLAGAMMRDDYIGCIEDAGFEDVRVIGETSFSFSSLLNDPAAKAIIDEAKISEEEARETEGAVVSIKIEGRKR